MTCGGTGGHINPAIAVANRIKTISPGAEIAFVGTEKGMEASLVPKAGYSIRFVKVRGFKRKLTLANIDAAVKAVTSVVAAKKIIRDFSPDVVIGTGGYVSWPTVKAAAKLGVPTLIQEQNAFPGVTQRMLAKYADKICVSFEESRKFFDDAVQDKILLTGNPVAASAFTRAQAREKLGLAPDALYVVSSGGSLGAEKVNEYVFEVIGRVYRPEGHSPYPLGRACGLGEIQPDCRGTRLRQVWEHPHRRIHLRYAASPCRRRHRHRPRGRDDSCGKRVYGKSVDSDPVAERHGRPPV